MKKPSQRLSVLFLTPSFPDERHPAAGTFVRRHVEAIARYCDVAVVHVEEEQPESDGLETRVVVEPADGFRLIHVYFRCAASRHGRLVTPNIARPVYAAIVGMRALGTERFDIVHGTMTRGCGLAALVTSRMLRVPYVVTEHYSGMLRDDGDKPQISHFALMRLVVASAGAVTAVSKGLATAMQHQGLKSRKYVVIGNVAEPGGPLVPRPPFAGPIPFVHVSFLVDATKNVSGLLRAVRLVADKRRDFRLHIIGAGHDGPWLEAYAAELGLTDLVVFEGLKRHKDVLTALPNYAFLVMFSNVETFCVALAEAIATGIPVIAPSIIGPRDFMSPEVGLTVQPRDDAGMAEAIDWMLDRHHHFDPQLLRDYAAARFGLADIGRKFETVYREVLERAA